MPLTGPLIAQLILTLGPVALRLIPELAKVWSKPALTPDEVEKICSVSDTPYEDYIKGKVQPLTS